MRRSPLSRPFTAYLADAKARELADATLYKLEIQLRKQLLSWCKPRDTSCSRNLICEQRSLSGASWTDGGLAGPASWPNPSNRLHVPPFQKASRPKRRRYIYSLLGRFSAPFDTSLIGLALFKRFVSRFSDANSSCLNSSNIFLSFSRSTRANAAACLRRPRGSASAAWFSKLETCCALAVEGRIGSVMAGADFFLTLTRLDMFAIPIRATIAISAITMCVLFFTGPTASHWAGTVAAGVWLRSGMASSSPCGESPRASCRW